MLTNFFEIAFLYHKGRRAAFRTEEFILLQIGYPLVTLLFYCLIASYSFKTADLTRWVVGNSFLLCTNTCIFGLGGMFATERYFGRLRSIIASPYPKLTLIIASGLFPIIFAIGSTIIGLIFGTLVFGIDLSNMNLVMVMLIIIIAMLSATSFGLFISLFGLISDSMHLILNIVNYVLLIFTGAQFPVSQLPLLGRIISQALPLTKSIQAMNLLFEATTQTVWYLIFGEIITAFIYILLAQLLFSFAVNQARKAGNFDLY